MSTIMFGMSQVSRLLVKILLDSRIRMRGVIGRTNLIMSYFLIHFEVFPKGKSEAIMPRTEVDLSVTNVAMLTPVLCRKFKRDLSANTSIEALLPT